ncbi:M16 family metallopeptidase [Undibacterium danionis]|uniref:M16 family metallopeptidase n=1 Tax=Undibacterium danionis TaxID=1812100 RepID=A0ABV6IBN4_9BURK
MSLFQHNRISLFCMLVCIALCSTSTSALTQAATSSPTNASNANNTNTDKFKTSSTSEQNTLLKTDATVKIGKLANGLTYYIKPNDHPKQKVELRLVIKAGSIDEDDDQQGVAHFVEHMAFNGSRHFPGNSLVDALRSIGLQFGADLNATTQFDNTSYLLPVPTDKKDNLRLGFTVLQDWASGLDMRDEEIEKERKIILEEARLRKGAMERMMTVLRPELLNHSKYAIRIPIGLESTIANAEPETIRRYYRDWYRPDLMAVIVVGDVSTATAEALIREHFAGLKNPDMPRQKKNESIPAFTASKPIILTDKEQTQNILLFAYSPETYRNDTTIADYKRSIIEELLSKIITRRLTDVTQKPNAPFSGFALKDLELVGSHNFSSLIVGIGSAGRKAAIDALFAEIKRVHEYGVSDTEFDQAKKQIVAAKDTQLKEAKTYESNSYVTEYINHFLYGTSIFSTEQDVNYTKQVLVKISLENVNAHAKTVYKNTEHKLLAYLGNSKDNQLIPTESELVDEVVNAENAIVTVPVTRRQLTQLMEHKPIPGKILHETYDKALNVSNLILSNGIRVLLKPTHFKNDEIIFTLEKSGGTSLFPDNEIMAANFSNHLVTSMGLDRFTPSELGDLGTGKRYSLIQNIGTYSDSLYGSSTTRDIESFLQILFLRITSPRKDTELFESSRKNFQASLVHAASSPEIIYFNQRSSFIYDQHPRAPRQLSPKDLDQLNMENELEIYQQRYNNFNGATAVIVGNFDLKKMRQLLKQYIATLPSTDEPTRYRDIGLQALSGNIKKDFFAGSDNKSIVNLFFSGSIDYEREERARFYTLMEVLQIKLEKIVREKLGLIYTASIDSDYMRVPHPQFEITFNLPCAPENTDKVIAAVFEEIKAISAGENFAEELAQVKKNAILSHKENMVNNIAWRNAMLEAGRYNTSLDLFIKTPEWMSAITVEEIQKAAKRFLNDANVIQTVLKPKANAPSPTATE